MQKIRWVLGMAWRDSRGSRRRLLLFISSMVLGVAALVAISSFGENLKDAVDAEAMTLLGADLSIESRSPFGNEVEAIIDSLGGDQSRIVSFASMAYFPKNGGTRLSTIRAQEGAFPYYGAVETSPPEAAANYMENADALVDGELIEQFGVAVGDSVKVGTRTYRIAGELLKTPRESAAMMMLSPRIYIPLAEMDTLLLTRGSLADFEVYFKFDDGRDVEGMMESLGPRLRAQNVGFDTIAEMQREWNEGLTNLYRFLNLVGFIALLLGGIGIASAVHVYIKQRIETVAVLRCIGAQSMPTFAIYLVQATAMGLLAACFGSLIGLGVQWLLPQLLADFLPVEVTVSIKWIPVLIGLAVGLGVSLLFALLPLLSVKNVSPLLTLRKSVEATVTSSGWRYVIYGMLGLAILGFSIAQAPMWQIGLAYAGGIFVVFGLLALVAKGIVFFSRKFFPSSWPYPWRQGFSNLFRPNNQTVILMLSLGLGTFLIATLFLVQQTLLNQIQVAGGDDRPNMILFDIQPDQLEPVTNIVEARAMPVIDRVPIITMRIAEVNGRTIDEIKADTSGGRYSWAHRREYRSSYRDYLSDAETLVEGEFVGEVAVDADVIPISIEEDVSNELNVALGDEIVWDVQGVPITTQISSVRKVDWQRMETNFFVLFPKGVLEEAPQFFVMLTKSDSDEQAGQLQSAIVAAHPNVSSVDLKLILTVFDSIYSRISFVLEFTALFSILTGVIVLISAVSISRFQRISESVLLKTLGASRSQVIKILLIEYLFLGLFAALTGILLALASAWLLSFFVFDTVFVPALGTMLAAVVLVTALTVAVGMFNSRGIYARPPLEVLRAES
ncbi:MAG: FtsX-like permease family protein [Bacteroidota bacterium]